MISQRDSERFALISTKLHTSVIGDVLDALGYVHQFLSAAVHPLLPEMKLVGRAMPVLIADVFGTQAKPFGLLTEALDSLKPGDIYLARRSRIACAAWGEIMTTAAKNRGSSGAVIDGHHRDTRAVIDQDFPVFSRGGFGQDAGKRAVVLDFGVKVEVDGVVINPGDVTVGDRDGVVVIPAEVEDEVLEMALAKVATENLVRTAIAEGMSATEALATYGVL